MSTQRFIAITTIMILLLGGCRPSVVSEENSTSFDKVIARADNSYELTMSQLYDYMNSTAFAPKGGLVDDQRVAEFRDSILCDTLTGFDANEIILEDYYPTYRTYRLRYNDFFIQQFFKETVRDKVEIDSLEVVEFFNSNPDLFAVDEHVFVFHILISEKGLRNGPDSSAYVDMSEAELAAVAEQRAREIHSEINSLETFMESARKYSHDTLAGVNGGVLGWAKRNYYLDPFDSVAFALEKGEVSEPYFNSFGWHILYCEQHIDSGVPPLNEELYANARQNLLIDKSNKLGRQLLDSLFTDITVEYNQDILDSNLYLVDQQTWVAVVNGEDTIDCGNAQGAEFRFRNSTGVTNTTAEQKKQMLRQLVEHYRIIRAGRDMGLDTLPDIARELKALYHKYAKTIILRSYRKSDWKPDEDAIQEYYDQHIDEFQVDKPYVVQHIIVQDSLFGDFLREQAMSGIDFMDLAKEFYPGDEDVKIELADLGEIGPDDVPEAFWRTTQLTMPGEISHPVKTEYGYHIIKVLEHRRSQSVNMARSRIETILRAQYEREKYEAQRDDLFERYHIEFPNALNPVNLKPYSDRKRL